MASRKIINKYPTYSSAPGPQRGIVERETGKRLYAADIPYQEHMTKLSQKYLDTLKKIRHSEFKKPYLADDYVEMEYFFDGPRLQPPGTPDEGLIPDCEVGTEAAGVLDNWRMCATDDDCAGWVFTCAHKIVSFECLNCWIKEVKDLENDRVMVIICSKNDKITVSYVDSKTGKTKTVTFERECIGEGHNSNCTTCEDCPEDTYPPTFSYSSKQMAVNETQNLSATGGGGEPYTWSIISGSGSLSKVHTASGEINVYTAPASNANCANNPTIQITDYCGNQATLELAINAYTEHDANAYVLCGSSCSCTPVEAGADFKCHNMNYYCDGVEHEESGGCAYLECRDSGYCPDEDPCVNEGHFCENYCPTENPTVSDVRTGGMIAAGCCPAAVL